MTEKEPLVTMRLTEWLDERAKMRRLAECAAEQALEEAALECDRHAAFLKSEADAGGDFKHLMIRRDEALYNARRIRSLKAKVA